MRELCALVDHVLAVVEDKKQVAIREVAPERVGRLRLAHTVKAERPDGFAGNIRCLRTGGEIDEPDTVSSAPDVIARQLQSEAGLADTARAGQGHKPRPAQHLTHLRELPRPAEQRRQRRRKVVVRGRCPRRSSSPGRCHQALASHPDGCSRARSHPAQSSDTAAGRLPLARMEQQPTDARRDALSCCERSLAASVGAPALLERREGRRFRHRRTAKASRPTAGPPRDDRSGSGSRGYSARCEVLDPGVVTAASRASRISPRRPMISRCPSPRIS